MKTQLMMPLKFGTAGLVCVLLASGCQREQSATPDSISIENQISKLKSELEQSQATLSKIEKEGETLDKQLAEIRNAQTELRDLITLSTKAKEAAEKSIQTLKILIETSDYSAQTLKELETKILLRVSDIQSELLFLNLRALQKKSAILSTSKKEYDLAVTEMGIFPISVEKAEPYLDGHRVVLKVGNTLAVGLSGGKLVIKHGPRQPELPLNDAGKIDFRDAPQASYKASMLEWEKRLRNTEVSITGTLPSGAWTEVEVILTPSKPEEVAYLDVTLTTTGIRLGTR